MRRFRVLRIVLPALLAVLVTACGGGAEDTTTTAASNGETDRTEVVMESISFQPSELSVPVGTTVTWTNQDAVAHTATSEEDLWDSDNLARDDSFSFTFEEPGTYPYICEIHPQQMQATITVEG